MEMRAFLMENVYTGSPAQHEEGRAVELLCRLFEYYTKRPEALPAFYREHLEKEGTERMVCDYISGMTDQFAIATYERLFIPKVWKGVSHD